ncbi:Uncharacterized protein SCF082_LOCUS23943, partial [Durusdinium trenchii]
MGRPKPPRLPGREARRWDDPDSDDDDDGQPEFHPQTDQGLQDGDDDSEEDLKGSDSEGEKGADDSLAKLGGLEAFTKRKRPAAKEQSQDEGLWDPLAGLGSRKKPKSGAAPGVSAPAKASFGRVTGPAEGAAVILVGLSKAPQLNGKTGTVAAGVDGATGRCQVLLPDHSVKSLKVENLREVLTGAVVRLQGLQAAPELNGLTAECGVLDLTTQRYSVTLADGKETVKKVKEPNLQVIGRFLQSPKYLAAPKKPFLWKTVLQQGKDRERQSWSARLALMTECGLPTPHLVAGSQLVDAKSMVSPTTTPAEQLPLTEQGRLACRLLAVSRERDSCSALPTTEDGFHPIWRLEALHRRDPETPSYFLIPGRCTEDLNCLRSSASLAWPFYLQLCQAVVCLETPHHAHKAWTRMDQLLASKVLSQPVYLLGRGNLALKNKAPAESEGSWLLSDRAEELQVGACSDGQALPAERTLLELMAAALPEGWRKGAAVTCYRL